MVVRQASLGPHWQSRGAGVDASLSTGWGGWWGSGGLASAPGAAAPRDRGHGQSCSRCLAAHPGLLCPWVSRARILDRVAVAFSRNLPNPRVEPASAALAGEFLIAKPPGKPHVAVVREGAQSLCGMWIFLGQGLNPRLLHWQAES